LSFLKGYYFLFGDLNYFENPEKTVMVRINVLEGIKPPLPPATPREIFDVCLAALGFCAAAGLLTAGIIALLNFLLF